MAFFNTVARRDFRLHLHDYRPVPVIRKRWWVLFRTGGAVDHNKVRITSYMCTKKTLSPAPSAIQLPATQNNDVGTQPHVPPTSSLPADCALPSATIRHDEVVPASHPAQRMTSANRSVPPTPCARIRGGDFPPVLSARPVQRRLFYHHVQVGMKRDLAIQLYNLCSCAFL